MLQGIPVAPGIGVGRAVIVRFGGMPAFRRAIAAPELEEEERRLRGAARRVTEAFSAQSRRVSGEIGGELAAIIERMKRDRVNAEWALAAVSREFAQRLEASDSPAMRERSADITDVAREVGRELVGRQTAATPELPR